jgi:3-hydroxyisobutyrate dehydrogenase-like beta-hydroxyacid dehydrogenase
MRVGLIGVGRMGEAMARNIRAKGHALAVFDVRRVAAQSVVDAGATALGSPAEVAAASEIVLTSLPGPEEVEAVMVGPDGVERGIKRGSIVADTSTTSAESSRRLAERFRTLGVDYLDAPISGGREGAVAGTLTVMVGGEAAAFACARPVFEAIGADIHHIGPSGAGNGIKLIIQLIFMTHVATTMEGLALGERLGIPLEKLLDVIGTSSAGRPDVTKRYGKILSDDLAPRFEVTSALKDLALASELAAMLGVDAGIARAATESYRRAAADGFGSDDLIALRHMYAGRAAKAGA